MRNILWNSMCLYGTNAEIYKKIKDLIQNYKEKCVLKQQTDPPSFWKRNV